MVGPRTVVVAEDEALIRMDLVEMLAKELNLSTFSMAGTSMGGTISMHYASRNPEKVEKLILLSPGALNTRIRSRDTPPPLPPGIDLLKIITPKMMFEGLLNNGYGDKRKVTDQLITQWWEMMRREGQRAWPYHCALGVLRR